MGYFDGPDEIEKDKENRFFDRLGKAAGKAVARQKSNYEKAAEQSRNRSDERLRKDYENEHNLARKKAMENELKSRGYGRNE